MRATVHFDGAANPNPGKMGIGVVVEAPGKEAVEIGEDLGRDGTSNIAEYEALIRGLEEAKRLGADEVVVKGDSNLVVQQLLGRFRVKQPHLKPLHQRVAELSNEFDDFEIQWIPREQNKRADALANAAVSAKGGRGGPKVGMEPGKREHSILCPKCGKPCELSIQTFKDGSEHIREECAEHGFVGYAPDVEPFRTLARENQ